MASWKGWLARLLVGALLLLPVAPALAAEGSPEKGLKAGPDEGAAPWTEDAGEKALEDAFRQRIERTYAAAITTAPQDTFKGYCGSYVARQLQVLGIIRAYQSFSGRETFDAYAHQPFSSGGYRIVAYRAGDYTLQAALEAIAREEPCPTNILIGFQTSPSASGQKNGHTVFIHGMAHGKVFFSDNYDRQVAGVTYREGQPIVCSLHAFLKAYDRCRLDGVIHFRKTLSALLYDYVLLTHRAD